MSNLMAVTKRTNIAFLHSRTVSLVAGDQNLQQLSPKLLHQPWSHKTNPCICMCLHQKFVPFIFTLTLLWLSTEKIEMKRHYKTCNKSAWSCRTKVSDQPCSFKSGFAFRFLFKPTALYWRYYNTLSSIKIEVWLVLACTPPPPPH